jgi:hypothetical protein
LIVGEFTVVKAALGLTAALVMVNTSAAGLCCRGWMAGYSRWICPCGSRPVPAEMVLAEWSA